MRTDNPHVLLIEEEPTLAEITGFRLELLGYSVESVSTAAEAIDKLNHDLPDAILLGLTLAGSDGIELANRISNDERTHDIPIMALSSDADLSKVQRAFAAGAKEFLVTPYDPATLESKLEHLLAVPTAK
ncbi:MAG TPA: response regulator [Pirellulales bacterium]|jgi:CheY-like chemotaxis protein|nr:response regulator [Pirellulales bacterium]